MYTNITVEVDNYDEGEAEYDAADYSARVMGVDGDGAHIIICLCGNQIEASHIAALLTQHPFPTGERI